MIDHFDLSKVIVVGTCAGIDDKYETLDIFLPNKAVQYDCTVKEIDPLIKEKFNVDINLTKYTFEYKTGIIGTMKSDIKKLPCLWEIITLWSE